MDPLCGTLNYASAPTWWPSTWRCAAVRPPWPIRSAVDVFLTDGGSAWTRSGAGHDVPASPTGDSRLVEVNLDPPFPNAPAFRAVGLLAHPGFVEHFRPRVVSTSLALAWVAAGRRAAYVTDGADLAESVHFAAGIALCRAAGCVVTGIDGAPLGAGGRGLVAAADARPMSCSCRWSRAARAVRAVRAVGVRPVGAAECAAEAWSPAELLRPGPAGARTYGPSTRGGARTCCLLRPARPGQTCSSGGKPVQRRSAGRWPVSLYSSRDGARPGA